MKNIFVALAKSRADKFEKNKEEAISEAIRIQGLLITAENDLSVLKGNQRNQLQKETSALKDEIATLEDEKRDIHRNYNKDFDNVNDQAEERIRQINRDAEKLIEKSRKEAKDEAKKEYETEIKSLKTDTKEYFSMFGKYEGALLVIKKLESQVAELTKLNGNLLGNIPSIKANFTSPAVTVNN